MAKVHYPVMVDSELRTTNGLKLRIIFPGRYVFIKRILIFCFYLIMEHIFAEGLH